MAAGEHRRRQVNGDVQHIQTDQPLLHHRCVDGARIAAVQLVEEREALIGGAQQRAGAAREIADPQRGERLRFAPLHAARCAISWDRETGEQGRRSRPRVVGREKLAVGDQSLKDDAGQIVRAGHPAVDQTLSRLPERPQHLRYRRPWNECQDLAGRSEDRPVVDIKDALPFIGQLVHTENFAVCSKLRQRPQAAS